jgi:arginase
VEVKQINMMNNSEHKPRIGIIGVPTNSSGTVDGVALAPPVLRQVGLLKALEQRCEVVDYSDLDLPTPLPERAVASGIIAEDAFSTMIAAVHMTVKRALYEHVFPLVLGGDCPILLGCLAAARDVHGPSGLLFVDGHEDAYPPHHSLTGEAADMELGLALGRNTAHLPVEVASLLPLVHPFAIALLGPRDANILKEEGVASLVGEIKMYDDATLRMGNIEDIIRESLTQIRAHTNQWWLHTDLDVLSSEALPAVDYLQPGGLNWTQLEKLTATAVKTPGIIGWNVTIYNPDLDPDRNSALRIIDYLSAGSAQLIERKDLQPW